MATKILNGRELAGFVKERQAHTARALRSQKIFPKLLILRDSDNPVITKYVELKKRYGADIGLTVEDFCGDTEALKSKILSANDDPAISGMIVQLPLRDPAETDGLVSLIAPGKDVDGLSGHGRFDSATATAINWLLAGYDIHLDGRSIAIVGRGRLVGAPLEKMWANSGYSTTVFHRGSDLDELKNYDIIVTATGSPHLIKSAMVKAGAVVVDAGTASEGGVLLGDVEDALRSREDLLAITPKIGGVGPLTVSVLFENVIAAATKSLDDKDTQIA